MILLPSLPDISGKIASLTAMHPPVRELLDELSRSIAAHDLAASVALFTEDAIVAGTGEDELGEGSTIPAFFEMTFALGVSLTWTWQEPMVRREGDLAWYYVDGSMQIDGTKPRPYRSSGVLKRRADGWRFALWHGAEPA